VGALVLSGLARGGLGDGGIGRMYPPTRDCSIGSGEKQDLWPPYTSRQQSNPVIVRLPSSPAARRVEDGPKLSSPRPARRCGGAFLCYDREAPEIGRINR
jgi:hypothetical protein